ncbi:MAG: ABC transporter ATP-binding protein, partial [SAR324 cluster bacterium]|nr:ABC transporter ATP-binding protein [SAR324 cluster bacterium]
NQIIDDFDVRTTGEEALASSLSGGNLQKFIVGREILQQHKLLIISQPTWGVDAGAAAEIHRKIQAYAESGAAILLISQDLDEIFLLSHMIAVISQGTLSRAEKAHEMSAEQVGLLMGMRHDQKSGNAAA